MQNLLEILILTLRKFIKLPVLRYLGICNVLYIWHIWVIPTYRDSMIHNVNIHNNTHIHMCAHRREVAGGGGGVVEWGGKAFRSYTQCYTTYNEK